MKKEGDIKRRYQHPDAVSYTPESKDGLMLLIKPSFSFENRRHIYFVAAHKLILNVSKIRLWLICARASYLYPLFSKVTVPLYRKEVGVSVQKQVCAANSQLKDTRGHSFLNAPAGVFYSLLASVSPISKRQTENLFSKVSILFRSANTIYTNSKNYLPLANTHRPTLVDTVSTLFASAYINSG